MKSGVVCLRNLKTDRVYLFLADDIEKENAKVRFQLDLGMHPCDDLQEDYTNTGLEVFRFDTVEFTEDRGRLAYYQLQYKNQYGG